ncbi:MAG: sigma-70 family RNA polymerase sigma factor [Anaerolineae bacterium]|nr:sigma-70 family RNA polymerase sigma factor [Gemmatimonadaceae bacterium]
MAKQHSQPPDNPLRQSSAGDRSITDAMPAELPNSDPIARFEHEALASLPDVARFARSLTRDAVDAEDLVQETFLRAFRSWHTFIPGSDSRRWLFTICRNIFLRGRERDSRMVNVDDVEAEPLAAVRLHIQARDTGLNDMFTRLDVAPAIESALAALPESFSEVVRLVDVEGFAYEEAAEALSVPVGTVRSRLYRARRLLQAALLKYAQDLGLAKASGNDETSQAEHGK